MTHVRGGSGRPLRPVRPRTRHQRPRGGLRRACPERRPLSRRRPALKRATTLRDNLRGPFSCSPRPLAPRRGALEGTGTQKLLSRVAHARVLTDLHKRSSPRASTLPAAALLSTAAPGAMAWSRYDQFIKADTLSGDIFRTATRFLGSTNPFG